MLDLYSPKLSKIVRSAAVSCDIAPNTDHACIRVNRILAKMAAIIVNRDEDYLDD